MRSFTAALISTLLLSPISVLSTNHENNSDLHHVNSSPHQKSLTVSLRVKYNDEDRERTCRIDDEEYEGEYEEEYEGEYEGEKREKKKGKGKHMCKNVHSCQKKSNMCRGDGISPKDGYMCGKKFIKLSKVMNKAKKVCRQIKKGNDQKLPALYTAGGFGKQPYTLFESPLYNKFWKFGYKQQYRLVMSRECTVVGTVVRNKDTSYSQCTFGPRLGRKH